MNEKQMKAPAIQPPDPRRDGFASGEETARFLGLSRAMITKLIATNRIPHRRYGRSVRVPWSWLLAEVEKTAPNQPGAPSQPAA